jgi:4'-phosphopantetheinyl transferase
MPDLKIHWPHPPENFPFTGDGVDVWAVPLEQTAERLAFLDSLLSAPEKTRAAAFRFGELRDRFVAARGTLRVLLGHYLNRAPQTVEFRYGAHGKPELAGNGGTSSLRFNLSHSENLGLFAFTRGTDVGIDVEKIRTLHDEQALANRFFTPRESATLAALRGAEKVAGFFKLWTRKEAWFKAAGTGISGSLAGIEVSPPQEPARIVAIHGNEHLPNAWSLMDLQPATGFTAAVAVHRKNPPLHCWLWPE